MLNYNCKITANEQLLLLIISNASTFSLNCEDQTVMISDRGIDLQRLFVDRKDHNNVLSNDPFILNQLQIV